MAHQGGHPRGWDCRIGAHRGLRWSKWLWCLPLQTAAATVASVGSAAAATFSLVLSPLSWGVHGECEVGRVLVLLNLQVTGGVLPRNFAEEGAAESRGRSLALRPGLHVERGSMSPANSENIILTRHYSGVRLNVVNKESLESFL